MLSSALDDLVDAGAITTEQESAITEAISSAMPRDGPGEPGATQTGSCGS